MVSALRGLWPVRPLFTNTAFDIIGGYFIAGSAFDAAECRGGAANTCAGGTVAKLDAQDTYTLAARVRLAF
jgi:hypothetical protein